MAILTKVTIGNQKINGAVTVKNVSGGLQQTNKVNPVSLTTNGVAISRFDELLDVQEGTPSNGDIVVYNASTDKYEVKGFDETSAVLDGGSF